MLATSACIASFVGMAALVGNGQRSAPSGTLDVSVTNLRLAGWGVPQDDLLLYSVDEFRQGMTDLNGDGDADDTVLHLGAPDGTVTNLRLATLSLTAVSHDLVVFMVDEHGQASTDLNGDGDTFDAIVQVFDRVEKRSTTLGVATSPFRSPQVAGRNIAFGVPEHDQGGTDLNGDGDTNDVVVHVYRPGVGVTNLGLALSAFSTTAPPEIMALDGDLLVFLVGEDEQRVDLNGDGALGDNVLHTYDFATGTVRNLGLSLGQSDTDAHLWKGNAGLVVFGVSEAAQGGTDLNGDGDVLDIVPHVLRVVDGTVRNLGLASVPFSFQQGYVLGDSFAAFLVGEANQGGTVLNGDGDVDDVVAFVYDAPSDSVHNLGLAVKRLALNQTPLWAAAGRHLAFQVSESAERRDLDGDGDIGNDNERVLHVHDLDANATHNVGLAVIDGVASEDQLAFRVSEALQGNHDLTGDGDTSDAVLHLYDFRTGHTRSSGTSAADNYTLTADVVLFTRQEFVEHVDLNGDGDMGDDVAFVFGAASGVVRSLGLAVPRFGPFSLAGQLSPRRTAVLSVPESDQGGIDLNGDGDSFEFDFVLHRIDVGEISRLH